MDLDKLRRSYIRNAVKHAGADLAVADLDFIAEDIRAPRAFVEEALREQ
jgi:hypothetical protein